VALVRAHVSEESVASFIRAESGSELGKNVIGNYQYIVGFEVFTAVTMKNGVFWDVKLWALVRTDVSVELSASFIRLTRICELRIALAVTNNRRTLYT
jgi:hypothetical protein